MEHPVVPNLNMDPDRDGLGFLKKLAAFTIDHLKDRELAQTPLRPSVTAAKLRQSLGCFGANNPEPSDVEALLETCKKVILHSVRTAHPNFVSQIYSKVDLYGVAADLLVAALNNNAHVFQLAPALSVVEKDVLAYLSRSLLFDSSDGATSADGVFVPGSSYGSFVALFVAMSAKDANVATVGLGARASPFVLYCSENAHYSIDKAAMLLGLGRDNLCKISCDANGRMRPDLLKTAISKSLAESKTPLSVVATAGSTVLGAFDPLPEIAAIARSNDVWLHVDAAWGGAAAFSKNHRPLLAGLNKADSLVFSAHKMLGAPIQCSAVLVHARRKGRLAAAASLDAPYLYQNTHDDPEEEPDLSRSTFQCGRRSDALKLWLMMHAHGDEGLQRRVDGCAIWAEEFAEELGRRYRERGTFQIYQKTFTTVCFWYVPSAYRTLRIQDLDEKSEAWYELDRLPALLRDTLIRNEHPVLISYGHAKVVPAFFRLGLASFPGSEAQRQTSIQTVLDTLEHVAEHIPSRAHSADMKQKA